VQVAIPEVGSAGLNAGRDEFSPEIPVEARLASSGPPPAPSGSTMDRGMAVRAALKAGVLGVFIGILPLLGIVLTGALAVYFYRRESGLVLPAALGARLGGAAGVVVFAINALFTIPIIVFHAQEECIASIVKIAQKYGVDTSTPQFQASVHSLFTPSGLAAFFIFALLLASLGGALASLFLRPRNPRA